MNIGIVITLYNRENTIDIFKIGRFLKTHKNIHICFVNNGSTDGTLGLLKLCKEKYIDRMSIVSLKKNRGNDPALKIGFRFLMNKKNVDHVSLSNDLNSSELTNISQLTKVM